METFQSERGDDYRVWSLDLMVTTHVTARLLVARVLQSITISMGRSRWWVENIDPSLLLTNITPIHRPGSYILLAQFTFLRREVVWCYIFVVWLASQMLSQMISGHVLWPSPSHSTMFVQPSPSTLTSSPDGDYCQEFNTNWAQCCAGWWRVVDLLGMQWWGDAKQTNGVINLWWERESLDTLAGTVGTSPPLEPISQVEWGESYHSPTRY